MSAPIRIECEAERWAIAMALRTAAEQYDHWQRVWKSRGDGSLAQNFSNQAELARRLADRIEDEGG